MRTIMMILSLFCLVLLGAPAFGQEAPTPTAEELRQQAETLKLIADAKAQLAALEAAKVAEPVHVNSPRRHHVYVDACGVQILNQPANGRHTERMMAQSNDCARTQLAALEAEDRGQQGDTMTQAMAAAIVSTNGSANTYADTQSGQFATGQAATYAAMADSSLGLGMVPGESVAWGLSRVHALSALQALEVQNTGAAVQPAPVSKTPSAPRSAPQPTPPVDKAAQAKSDLFKE